MFSIYRYSMIYTFKKVSTYIMLSLAFVSFLGAALLFGTTFISEGVAEDVPKLSIMFLNPYNILTYFFVGLFSGSYVAMKTLNIFKDGEVDGSNLLLVSKKFTRLDIILGKFFAMLTHIFLVAFISGVAIMFAGFFVKGPSNISFAFSTFFGMIFIGFIFSSVALLIALQFGKVGTLFILISTSTMMPVVSTVMQAIGSINNGTGWNADEFLESSWVYDSESGKYKEEKYIFDPNASDGGYLNEKEYDTFLGSRYNSYKYFDIWYQITAPLTLFNPEIEPATTPVVIGDRPSNFDDGRILNIREQGWEPADGAITTDQFIVSHPVGNLGFSIGEGQDSRYYEVDPASVLSYVNKQPRKDLMTNQVFENLLKTARYTDEFSGTSDPLTLQSALDIAHLAELIATETPLPNGTTITEEMIENETYYIDFYHFADSASPDWYIDWALTNGTAVATQRSAIDEDIQIGGYDFSSVDHFKEVYNNHSIAWSVLIDTQYENITFDDNGIFDYTLTIGEAIRADSDAGNYRIEEYDEDKFYEMIENEPYIHAGTRSALWIVLSLLLLSGSFLIYYKRDFK